MIWDGNIQIPRSMIYHPIIGFPNTERLAAFIWMLSEARPTAGSVLAAGRLIHLERGQFCHPILFMAHCCWMSMYEFKRFLALLEDGDGFESLIKTHDDGGRLVTTIRNYDRYQQPDGSIEPFPELWQHRAKHDADFVETRWEAYSQSLHPSDAELEKARQELAARRQAPIPIARGCGG